FASLCSSTTMHGISNVFDPSSATLRKGIWSVVFLCSFIFCAYEIGNNVRYYLTKPVNTVFKIDYVDEIKFPAVTICNNNPIRKSWAATTPYLPVIMAYNANPGEEAIPINWDAYNWTGFGFDKLMSSAAHLASEMIHTCKWKGIYCSAANFTLDATFLGGCYTFNIDQRLMVTGTGMANALHLVLNIQQNEYIGNVRSGAGFRLLFREKHEPPSTDRFVIALQPGTQTLIPLTMKKLISLPEPFGVCQEKNNLKMFDKYSVTACEFECRARLGGKLCGCREMYPSSIKTEIPVCLPKAYRDCLNPLLVEISVNNLCRGCKNPCNKVTFVPRMSYSQYPANHIADSMAMSMNTTRDFVRDNFLEVEIYFEDIMVEIIEQQEAFSLTSLVGIIGGTLGVFIGASIITVSEFMEFLILIPFRR
ncbi:predicted protein, partial [Nematostella vectensis]